MRDEKEIVYREFYAQLYYVSKMWNSLRKMEMKTLNVNPVSCLLLGPFRVTLPVWISFFICKMVTIPMSQKILKQY